MDAGRGAQLLIVEDDPHIAELLRRGLTAEGYQVCLAGTGPEGLSLALERVFDLIVLDVRLPELSGFEVCERLRSRNVMAPVLMLTAMDTTEHKIEGLGKGADDYLAKPFDVDELLARIEALIRRRTRFDRAAPRILSVGDLSLHTETLMVTRGGVVVELTSKEIALLKLLMESPGKVFSRDEVIQQVWHKSDDPLTNIVDVYIRRLRAKIGDDREPRRIRTVRGIGYRIFAE